MERGLKMADIKQCDRCGGVYERYVGANGLLFHKHHSEMVYRDEYFFDLCPQCMESLLDWFGDYLISTTSAIPVLKNYEKRYMKWVKFKQEDKKIKRSFLND